MYESGLNGCCVSAALTIEATHPIGDQTLGVTAIRQHKLRRWTIDTLEILYGHHNASGYAPPRQVGGELHWRRAEPKFLARYRGNHHKQQCDSRSSPGEHYRHSALRDPRTIMPWRGRNCSSCRPTFRERYDAHREEHP